MAFEEALTCLTRPAAADLSASQWCFVKIDANGRVALAGEGDRAVGVLQNKPTAIDRAASYAVAGVTKCVAGGVITAGNPVSVGASGKATAVGSSDDQQMGVSYETTVLNQVFPLMLDKRGLT